MTETPGFPESLASARDEMIALLSDLVNIDSPSRDPAGVDAVRDRIASFLDGEPGIRLRRMPVPGHADALLAEYLPQSPAAPGLLMGHMDTVFARGEATARPFRIEAGRAHGPGVADMKAGLVMNAFVLRELARSGLAVPLRALFTVDEEIGSNGSAPVIREVAARSAFVLNSEPGRVSGNVVDGRRGGAFYRVTITGRAAHAGLNPADGRSAIVELAQKILAWTALTDPETGVSVSVGIVSGGQAVNMVAPGAEARIDVRFATVESGEAAEVEIRRIAETPFTPDVDGRIECLGKFLPMTGNAALTADYIAAAAQVGLALKAEFTPSCSDAGLTSSMGIPTLCACGPVGGGVHSEREFLELDTLVPRAMAAARLVLSRAAA